MRKTSEIIDLVNVFDRFENTDEENFQEQVQGDACKPGFQHTADYQC